MKFKEYVPWLVAGGLGLGVMYYMATRQPVPAVAVAPGAPPAPMSVPTYTGELSVGAMEARNILLSLASKQLGLPPGELVMRGLRPEDLGLTTSWSFTSTAANTWENWITATVADNTFISIDGVSYGGTSFSQLRIQAGARYSAFFDLNFISGLISQLWYSMSPVIAEQNQPVIVDVISNAVATEFISLIGTVVEKRGLVINP